MEILIKRLSAENKMPAYASLASAGIELYSLAGGEVRPGEKVCVSTGIAFAMPVGFVGLLRGRYGVSSSDSIKVSAGFIDSSYRKEVKIELKNTGDETYTYERGDTVAQLLIQEVHRANLIEAEDLSGFNSV